jgi:hypothetical protein
MQVIMPDASEAESASKSYAPPPPRSAEGPSVADAVRESGRTLAELAQYAGYLFSAKVDQVKLTARTLILYTVLGVLAAAAAATVMIVAVVMLFIGAADGLGALLGGRNWLGDLIVGVVVLGAIALTFSTLLSKFNTASRRRTMRKYEERRKQQREQFGHDVAERAGH